MCVLKITVRIWHFWYRRERATSFHLCHTEAETHGSHLQPRLADLGLHSFVFCQDLGLIFPTLPSPASFARHSNLVSYCGHYWGTAMVRRWLDFMIHCRLLGCENFFKRSSEFYRLRKKKLLRQHICFVRSVWSQGEADGRVWLLYFPTLLLARTYSKSAM